MADDLPSTTEELEPISFAEFLEAAPPNRLTRVAKLAKKDPASPKTLRMAAPQLQLHCTSESCNGVRFFSSSSTWEVLKETVSYHFLNYICRNCSSRMKVYAIGARVSKGLDGEIFKFGETPPFGPFTSPRVIKLIGPDRELFLMGRRAENHGLGIGAFAYYRRVVENQKSRLIEEIIRVSEKIGVKEDVMSRLRAARDETQSAKPSNM